MDVFRPATVADKQRWRQRLLGLDPDSPASYADVSRARLLAAEMHAGRRPDLAPSEDYNPPWPLNLEGEEGGTADPLVENSQENEQSEVIPPSMLFSKLSLSQPQTQALPSVKPIEINPSSSTLPNLETSLLSGNSTPPSTQEPAVTPESFTADLILVREKREAEQTTKEGRAKWDKIESGLPGTAPPGTYKRVKERLLARRTAQKLNWQALQKAVGEHREKVKEGTSVGPAIGSAKTGGGGKGKKGRK